MCFRTKSRPMRGTSSNAVSDGTGARINAGEERDGVFEARQTGECRRCHGRLRKQAQGRRGDDAERPFRADEKILEVIAAIVFAQAFQPVPDAAIGEHDLEPEGEIARAAVSQHRHAAGIGGEHAADLAASLRGKAQRQEASRRSPPRSAPLASTRPASTVMVLPARSMSRTCVMRLKLTTTSLPLSNGNLPADETGIAALRDDGRARLVGELEDRGNLLRRSRLQHQRGLAVIAVAPLLQVRRHGLGIADRIGFADDASEGVERGLRRALEWGRAVMEKACWLAFLPLLAAARLRRSLIASPRPLSGIGITAIAVASRPSRLLQRGKEIRGGFGQIAARTEIERRALELRRIGAEGEQGLAR